MTQDPTDMEKKPSLPPARDLWQIPGIAGAVVIFLLAAYITKHPIVLPSSRKADFKALLMAYDTGNIYTAAESAQRYLARYPSAASNATVLFIFADSRWNLIRANPAAITKDLSICLDSFDKALSVGLPPEKRAKALKAKGDILLRMGRPSDALQAYTQLAQEYPQAKDTFLSVALAYLDTKPPAIERAAEFIDKYLAVEGLSPREIQLGYLAKARLEMAKGHFAAAAQDAQKVIDAGPDGETVAQAHLILCRALMAGGDFKGALKTVKDKAGPGAGRFEAALALARARALWKAGFPDEARKAFDETIFSFPGTPQALGARFFLSSLLFETGHLQAAKDGIIGLLDDMSGQETIKTPYFDIDEVAELWFAVGRSILDAKGYTAAHEFNNAALAHVALMPQGHFLFFDATLYLREAEQREANLPGLPLLQRPAAEARAKRSYFKAGSMFAKALESAGPRIYKEALYKAGHSFFKAGEYSLAVDYLLQFTKVDYHDSRIPKALYEVSDSFASIGSYSKAISICKQNIEEHPANIYAYRSMLLQGDLYRAMGGGDIDIAAKIYGRILTDTRFGTQSVEWRKAIFALGETLYRMGRYKEALLKLEEAIKRFPNDALVGDARYYLALSYMRAGLASANMHDELLLKGARLFGLLAAEGGLGGKDKAREASFLEADCYYDLGDYKRAVALYDRAAEANVDTPAATRALFQIANCYHHLGQVQKAKTTYKRAMFNLKRQKQEVEPGNDFYESLAQWRGGGQA